jgi:hypothetical protein
MFAFARMKFCHEAGLSPDSKMNGQSLSSGRGFGAGNFANHAA